MNKATRIPPSDRIIELGGAQTTRSESRPAYKSVAHRHRTELVAEASEEATPLRRSLFHETLRGAEALAIIQDGRYERAYRY